ncbi:diaminohydroxyphosphoribosylaminopyrimidine deaminase / 5-amino-6-(5-phosphoribosylamino)uracil reductase [Eubacterium ruminantium]|nr:diaminohydroxyphosphoribosylaminopyrimidine deaminase / 5-amino-6-(5-phosphoribosylamino)uracil reductase [Eubacterium ruminantium]
MAYDKKYMERAIELAKGGIGAVNPNPLVGAVIVKDGRIIAEGFHRKYGDLHAERDAFRNLTESAEGAEMYVTLEPCCHYGKQPPCVEAIVEHKIKRVYVGSDDPNPLVAGKGIAYLRDHDIEVITRVMKDECDRLNPVFFHFITHDRPYVVMKYAMTMDGKIATESGESKWISCEASRKMVHHFRNELSAIMVGIGTVLKDDPMLNCRIEDGRNPVRIVCDSHLRIPMNSRLVDTADEIRTILAAIEENEKTNIEKIEQLKRKKVEVLLVKEKNGQLDLEQLMEKLALMKIDSILLEGGGSLNWSMLKDDLVNELRVFIAPKIFGGVMAPGPVGGDGVLMPDEAFRFKIQEEAFVGEDIYLRMKLKNRAETDQLQEYE